MSTTHLPVHDSKFGGTGVDARLENGSEHAINLGKIIEDLTTTVTDLHSDILNLAHAQREVEARLKTIEFEREYYKQCTKYMEKQMLSAKAYVPQHHSCLIPPPPMPSMNGPMPCSIMRSPMVVKVPTSVVGMIIGKGFSVAKQICKSIRESAQAKAWFPDLYCRIEPQSRDAVKNSDSKYTNLIVKAKYFGVAEMVAHDIRQRVKNACLMQQKLRESASTKTQVQSAVDVGATAALVEPTAKDEEGG